jgi:ABC-type branched-subunit amino acid transport system permease subunit
MHAAPLARSSLPALGWAIIATLYGILFLGVEHERAVGALLAVAAAAVVLGARFGLIERIRASIGANERVFDAAAIAGLLAAALWFHEEHFVILMMTTALLLMVAALGLTIQFAYAGVVNFAGAAFLGIGCYTAAVVTKYTALPSILTLALGGLMAALIGSILILPVLRTRGHYAALITIAFGILFKVFLEVNDTLGGPQGIQVKPLVLFGWNFNSTIQIGDFTASFYFSYLLLALVLLVASFALVRRLERSWIGLSMDAIRLDEIASACYGLDLARWKVLAFTLGNLLAGIAGAAYGHVLGFIAPNNFNFGDSLILVSIVLLGGIGNLWGVAIAAAFVVILPEKFQVIQEYRFALYAGLVILILLFRPQGLLPRPLRSYLAGRKAPNASQGRRAPPPFETPPSAAPQGEAFETPPSAAPQGEGRPS